MARAVERAIERARLPRRRGGHRHGQDARVPRARRSLSGRRVIVSTATKTLQEQIWGEGHPAPARERAGLEFAAAYLKGRSNYFCLARGDEFARAPTLRARARRRRSGRASRPGRATTADRRPQRDRPPRPVPHLEGPLGDDRDLRRPRVRALRGLLRHPRARARRAGGRPAREPPPVLRRPRHAHEPRAGVEILPEHDVVVFDEAHAIEDVATEYFGLQVSSYRVEELARDALRAVGGPPGPRLDDEARRPASCARRRRAVLRGGRRRAPRRAARARPRRRAVAARGRGARPRAPRAARGGRGRARAAHRGACSQPLRARPGAARRGARGAARAARRRGRRRRSRRSRGARASCASSSRRSRR